MTTEEKIAPVLEAFAKIGVDLEEAHQADLEKAIENVADADARAIMDSLAQHIVMHGLASGFQNVARNDVTGSENDIVALIDSNIVGGVEWFDGWLRKVAGEPPAK